MILSTPVEIAPNLEPAVRIGPDAWVTIAYSPRPGTDGRTRYRYSILRHGHADYIDDDLQSGCQGGDLREGLISLLSFLGAAAESQSHCLRTGGTSENADLFPVDVVEWASANSNELGSLELELDESPDCIQE